MMVWLHFGLQYAKCKIWINGEFRESYYIKKLTLSHCFKFGQKKKQNKKQRYTKVWNRFNLFSHTDRVSTKSEDWDLKRKKKVNFV